MSSIGGTSMAMLQNLEAAASTAASAARDLVDPDGVPGPPNVAQDMAALLAAKNQMTETVQMQHEASAKAAQPLRLDVIA